MSKTRLKEKQVLEDQLKDNETSLDELLDKAATAKLAFKAASAFGNEIETTLCVRRPNLFATGFFLPRAIFLPHRYIGSQNKGWWWGLWMANVLTGFQLLAQY
jgi:hypothetical protein